MRMENFDEQMRESMDVAASLCEALSVAPRRRLQLYRSAHEGAAAQRKSPRQMRRAADANAFVRHNIESRT